MWHNYKPQVLLTWHLHQTEEFYESESGNEQFGLLKIKCPNATSFVEVPYLSEQDNKFHLKPTHAVYVYNTVSGRKSTAYCIHFKMLAFTCSVYTNYHHSKAVLRLINSARYNRFQLLSLINKNVDHTN